MRWKWWAGKWRLLLLAHSLYMRDDELQKKQRKKFICWLAQCGWVCVRERTRQTRKEREKTREFKRKLTKRKREVCFWCMFSCLQEDRWMLGDTGVWFSPPRSVCVCVFMYTCVCVFMYSCICVCEREQQTHRWGSESFPHLHYSCFDTCTTLRVSWLPWQKFPSSLSSSRQSISTD